MHVQRAFQTPGPQPKLGNWVLLTLKASQTPFDQNHYVERDLDTIATMYIHDRKWTAKLEPCSYF